MCIECGIETENPKFCSRSCAAKYNNREFPKRHWRCSRCNERGDRYSKASVFCINCKPAQKARDLTKQRLAELRSHKIRQSENRELIRQAKSKPCMDCGIAYPYYVMHLDHRNPKDKVRGLAKMQSYSKEAILLEIAKCDAVCANCHAIRTHIRSMAISSSGKEARFSPS